MTARAPRLAVAALLLATTAATTFAAGGYLQTNLVSNNTTLIPAAHQDPQLVNAWGIAFSATSPLWISDNATGLATVYDGTGVLNTGVAALIPGFASNPGTPTGAVFNGNNASFQITDGTNTKGANFLFVTEDGTLDAWNSGVGQPATGIKNHAFQVVNNNPNAVYKGLAIDNATTGTRLYAANFRGGTIDTFGPTFANVSLPAGAFTVPSLPAGFAPFNVQNLGGNLFVTYALQDVAKHDELPGAGLGLVAEFDTNGNFIKTIASGGSLNAPWGLALAPGNFGTFSNDLLIGNFGDGTINAFDLSTPTPTFKGQLTNPAGTTLFIDGLWGLDFGNGSSAPSNSLIFTAGPIGESQGLLGTLTPVPEPASLSLLSLALLPLLKRRR